MRVRRELPQESQASKARLQIQQLSGYLSILVGPAAALVGDCRCRQSPSVGSLSLIPYSKTERRRYRTSHYLRLPPLQPLAASYRLLRSASIHSPCRSHRSEERRVGKEGRSRWS